jgi:hypothetical protein
MELIWLAAALGMVSLVAALVALSLSLAERPAPPAAALTAWQAEQPLAVVPPAPPALASPAGSPARRRDVQAPAESALD